MSDALITVLKTSMVICFTTELLGVRKTINWLSLTVSLFIFFSTSADNSVTFLMCCLGIDSSFLYCKREDLPLILRKTAVIVIPCLSSKVIGLPISKFTGWFLPSFIAILSAYRYVLFDGSSIGLSLPSNPGIWPVLFAIINDPMSLLF